MVSNHEGNESVDGAIERLKQLGLKEYEARCFVGLSRMADGTAKDISEQSDVPRTRVYDATRVLEAKGLIEVQHGSPKRFRAASVDEAIGTLRAQFESQFEDLRADLEDLERPNDVTGDEIHEVWALAGGETIDRRARGLIQEAQEEVVIVIGVEDLLTDELLDELNEAANRGVSVVFGTVDEDLKRQMEEDVEDVFIFISGLKWLRGEEGADSTETAIGRILLVDRSTILVSSYEPETGKERSVFGRGFSNGLVLITRRLMETGVPIRSESATD
jgi:sugar-specific transcriptional regulator TrmB